MKKFLEEFKKFALKGNMIDLAVGMIIGSAFTSIVSSLVNDIFMPVLSLLTGKIDFSNMFIALDGNKYATLEEAGAAAVIKYGSFITQVINFVLMALVVFIVVKQLNKLENIGKKPEAPAAPTEKECPYCKTKIPVDAVRCPHCTSQLDQ
ncbi:MAG: large conductance mechanosensitive channel protein MscL [Enterocloster sp.]